MVKQVPEELSLEQGRILYLDLKTSLKTSPPRIVLDCSKVHHFDSTGIQVLLLCLEDAIKRNGDVKLAAVSPAATAILELTRVNALFETFDDISTAVNSYEQFQANAFQQGA
jgi:anti-sigma B factor antagonist